MSAENTHTFDITKLVFTEGVGDYDAGKACIMSACVAKWRLDRGEPLGQATDALDCVDPSIRRLAIAINDKSWWESDKERTEVLMPFIDKIIGTKGSEKLTVRRGYKCADFAVRVFLPLAFDKKWPDKAKEFRELGEIKDRASAIIGRDKSHAYAYADAAAAAAAADAAAVAAYADAAAVAAYAYADAADAAAAVAVAVAAYADAKLITRTEAIRLLSELCEMKD